MHTNIYLYNIRFLAQKTGYIHTVTIIKEDQNSATSIWMKDDQVSLTNIGHTSTIAKGCVFLYVIILRLYIRRYVLQGVTTGYLNFF